MMKTFARIEGGLVAELFDTDGDITKMFSPDFVWVDVTGVAPAVEERWTASFSGGAWSFSAPAGPSLSTLKQELCTAIDSARDGAYAAIGGASAGRIEEYRMARDDAQAYKNAGYTGTVPTNVAAWVSPTRNAQQAADSILATATAWESFVASVRMPTLTGKMAVNAAATEADANTAAQTALDAISSAVATAAAATQAAEAA